VQSVDRRAFHLKRALVDPNVVFAPHSRTFFFALQTLLHQWPGEYWPIQVVRVAAHEAMHTVQCATGIPADSVTSTRTLGTPACVDSPLEFEAIQESVDVLKGWIPGMCEPLPVGERLYPVPTTSRYTGYWEQVQARQLQYAIISRDGPGAPAMLPKPDL